MILFAMATKDYDQRLGLAIFFGGSDFCDTSYRHHAHLLGCPARTDSSGKLAASHVAFVLSAQARRLVGEAHRYRRIWPLRRIFGIHDYARCLSDFSYGVKGRPARDVVVMYLLNYIKKNQP